MSGAEDMVGVQERRTMRTSTTTRKVRNNKVYTAKGPRDRRIRLSADIAIQFYDVQDRLGYDRASEAVDWLISKAKASIDKLFETSYEQEFQHFTDTGAQNNVHLGNYLAEQNISAISRGGYGISFHQDDCLTENMLGREACRLTNHPDSSVDSSTFFPRIQMDNSLKDHHCLEYSSMASFQHIDDKAQNPRMVMCNSKLNPRNEEHTLIPNCVSLMSSIHTPTSDPTLNLCLPGYGTSSLSDTEQWTFF